MPSVKTGDLVSCLTSKLQAVEVPRRDHRRYRVLDDEGIQIAVTQLSRSWRASTTISAAMATSIRKQLRLANTEQLEQLIACPVSRADYIEIALSESAR